MPMRTLFSFVYCSRLERALSYRPSLVLLCSKRSRKWNEIKLLQWNDSDENRRKLSETKAKKKSLIDGSRWINRREKNFSGSCWLKNQNRKCEASEPSIDFAIYHSCEILAEHAKDTFRVDRLTSVRNQIGSVLLAYEIDHLMSFSEWHWPSEWSSMLNGLR